MAAIIPTLLSLLLLLLLPSITTPVLSATFTITNNCDYTVWPGILSNAGSTPLASTGFPLSPGESRNLDAPAPWSGRLWGRTICSTDPSNRFTCVTGDCGSGTIECSGGGAAPPATLAEFTLDSSQGLDFYDVSLVDGSNLPMLVTPQGGGGGAGNCVATGCAVDLNAGCPAELRVVGGGAAAVACKSACEAFGSPEYCCSGVYGGPGTCRPSEYSAYFKSACPRAYSYAYDDATSTFTCAAGASYVVTFCPSTTSQKSSGRHPQAVGLSSMNGTIGTMVYMGGMATNNAVCRRASPLLLPVLLAGWTLSRLRHL